MLCFWRVSGNGPRSGFPPVAERSRADRVQSGRALHTPPPADEALQLQPEVLIDGAPILGGELTDARGEQGR